jgi:DNA-binding MarR family transcriptional regulator
MGPAEQLYLAIQHSAQHFRVLDAELGLSPARFSVLATLRYGGPQRLGDLARRESVAQPTMTKLIAGLERDRLVIRRADSGDRRGTIVELTADGRALVRRARARKIDWIGRALREFPAADALAAGRAAERLDHAAMMAARTPHSPTGRRQTAPPPWPTSRILAN